MALTGLAGTGGFGKTTLASDVCRDQRVRQRFPDGILWVSVGEQVTGTELADKINDLAFQLSGERPSFSDPEQAGHFLGRLLEGSRCLLVIDDVWRASQLAPYLLGAPDCARLVTTRVRDALPDDVEPIVVDAMTPEQAWALLTEELPDLDRQPLLPLLAHSGNWPVLLRLVNAALRRYVRRGATTAEAALRVARQITARGPAALDITNSDQRSAAVTATVEASLSLLAQHDPSRLDRYLELVVFPEDTDIPQAVLARYWSHTGELTPEQVEQLCWDLVDLSLVESYQFGPHPKLRLHDIIRQYLRHRAGARLHQLHRSLLDAYRSASPVEASLPPKRTAWWELPDDDLPMRRQVTYHLQHAELQAELDSLAVDFRWICTILRTHGTAAVEADLTLATGPLAGALRRVIMQNAHLLTPIEPINGLAATLLSRLHNHPELAQYHESVEPDFARPYLAPFWDLPDLPPDSVIRIIRNHSEALGVAFSPDGTWLATAGADGSVRLWNTDGTERAVATGHRGPVREVAISPDGRWFATAGTDNTVRTWGFEGNEIQVFYVRGPITALAVSPCGEWLATASANGAVQTWNADGTARGTAVGHLGPVTKIVISPDGRWFATAGTDTTIRTWDNRGTLLRTDRHEERSRSVALGPDGRWGATAANRTVTLVRADGTRRCRFTEPDDRVEDLMISPDGTWLATTGSTSRTLRLWNTDGTERGLIPANPGWGRSLATAISPDSSCLATASDDQTVRLWSVQGIADSPAERHRGVDRVAISPNGTWLASSGGDSPELRLWNADGSERCRFAGHSSPITRMTISPDGKWFATTGADNPDVQLWNADGTHRGRLTGHRHWVDDVVINHDGSWLAAVGGSDFTVRLWDVDGTERGVLGAHPSMATCLAISPDDAWIAVGGIDREVRLWDVSGTARAVLTGHPGPITKVAISPDGSFLATQAKGDPDVRLWHPDGEERAVLTGHRSAIANIEISPDGQWLATSSDDGVLRVWAQDGTECSVHNAHNGPIADVAIGPDGDCIATIGAADRTVRLWSATEARCITALRTDSTLNEVAWFPDAPRIAVTSPVGLYVFQLAV
ncbi:NB-ARC domain-containing protein [Saccharopolyspora shandongensis]|uniref:NB-ARC domain-containing protein n=1 Tax=Saccharopolyspora shandongensis TaxID=418495 RepID=UPI0033E89795